MRWKRSALRLLVVVVALMTVAGALGPIGATAAAEGPPEPPHRFFGTVTDANGDAVSGATIEVVYDGEVVNSTTTDGDGYYDLTVADPDSGASDEQLTIRVADTDASAQYAWESGGSTEHDFPNVQDPTTPTPTPTTTTTTTTTDDGGGGGGGAPPGGGGGGSDTTTATTATTETTEKGIQDPTTSETRQGDAPTTDETSTTSPDDPGEDTTETTETTTDGDDGGILDVPGFGVGAALVALVAAALLALRRSRIDG